MHIRKELAKGTFWTAVGSYSRYIFAFVVSATLARLLDPADFGVVSMVVVYTGFVEMLAEFGISATVVQKRYLDHKGLSTVFWFATLIGFVLTGLSVLFAPLIESFFNFEGLKVVVQVMSLNLLLVSLGTVPQGLMRKNLAFKETAIIEIVATILSGVIGISLAFLGWGYWALVFQGISMRLFNIIGYAIYTRWLPQFTLQMDAIRDIIGFSGNLLGFRMINYWARNADNLLIGRFLGSVALGFYNQAYVLMGYPIKLVSSIINPSIQPVFATVQDEPEKIAPTYLLLLEFIAMITFPLGLYMFMFASPIILVLWGDQWAASIPVFRVLAFLTMVQPLLATSGSVFIARNKSKLLFRLGAFNSAIIIAGIALGIPFGIQGVAIGYAIAYLLIALPLTLIYLAKSLEISFAKMASIFIKPLLMAIIVLPFFLGYQVIYPSWGDVWIVASSALMALVIWAGAALVFYRDEFKSILNILRSKFNAKK